MNRLTLLSRSSAVMMVIGLAFIGLMAASLSDANAKPLPPDQDGQLFCIAYAADYTTYIPNGPNSCCYEEKQNEDGDTLKVCLKCDSEWKNCTADYEVTKIDRSNSQGKSSGTIAEPPRTPKIKILKPLGTTSQ